MRRFALGALMALVACQAAEPPIQHFPGTHPQAAAAPLVPHATITATAEADPANVYSETRAGMLAPAVAGVTERVYVPDSKGATVTVIDPKTFKVLWKIPTGRRAQHIAPAWDLSVLYAEGEWAGSLTVIDPRSGLAVKTLTSITEPYNLYFTPDGSKAIVVAEYLRRLDFRDPKTWKLLGSVPIPWPGVDHLDFTADGRYALVSTEYSGVLAKVDVKQMKFVSSLNVGGRPIDVRLSPDGTVFYVANQGTNGVSLIDPVKMQQVAFLKTGPGSHGLAVSRDTRFMYVSVRLAGEIAVIDLASRTIKKTWRVGGSPDMLQVSPDGRTLWTTNRFGGTVSVIDTRTGQLIKLIRTGGSPHGLCYFPQPGRFSLGHNGVYR